MPKWTTWDRKAATADGLHAVIHRVMECESGTVLSVSVNISVNVCQCRYTLGESLLYPSSGQQDSHTGIDQTSLGVSEAALSCLAILSDSQQQQQQRQLMMDNILLCGGCSMIPHFGSRFMTELRGYFPSTTPMSKLTCDPALIATGPLVAHTTSLKVQSTGLLTEALCKICSVCWCYNCREDYDS